MRLWLAKGGRNGEREQEALASNVLAPGFLLMPLGQARC